MSTVGKPVDPVEFTEIGSAAVDVDSGTEVRVLWRVLWEEELMSTRLEMEDTFAPLIWKKASLMESSWAFRMFSGPFCQYCRAGGDT